MLKSKNVGEIQNDVPYKKRGRPAGRNRVPLSLEERRARNAHYERERRNETADAMAQLAEAVGCDPRDANVDILATVISLIQRSNSERSVDDMKRINNNLESQIVWLQAQLGLTDEAFDQLDNEEFNQTIEQPNTNYRNCNEPPNRQKKNRKRSRPSSERSSQKEKRLKTRSVTSNDSGVEMQLQCVTPSEIFGNIRYVSTIEQPPTLNTIAEEEQHTSQAQIEQQAELYAQIYNPDTLRSTDSIPQWNDTSSSHSHMDSSAQSSMVPPMLTREQTESTEQSNVYSEELENFDLNLFDSNTESDILPTVESTLNLLTDDERNLIYNWLENEIQDNELNTQ